MPPPPFTFLRNLTNQQSKGSAYVTSSTENSSDQGDKPSKLVKRKSRKNVNDHITPNPSHTFAAMLGPASHVDDISPSRYPAHPFASTSRITSHHSSIANTGPMSYQPSNHSGANTVFEKNGSLSVPLSNTHSMLNRAQHSKPALQQHRSHESISSSTPSAVPYSSTEHSRHDVDADDSFFTQNETPMVSRYTPDAYRYSQVPGPGVLLPPSRSWSPIPSVHRESSRLEESFSPDREGFGDESWLESGNLGNRFSADVTDPRISTMADFGQPDSLSIHTVHYVEYGKDPKPGSRPKENSEHWEMPVGFQPYQDSGTRRKRSQTHFETPKPAKPKPDPIEPAMFDQEYWDDEDSDPEIYHYIVPVGLKVTFQDEDGNMITRVGRSGIVEGISRSAKSAPIVVHDEFGKELYRSKHVRGPSPSRQEFQQRHFRGYEGRQYDEQDPNFWREELSDSRSARGRHQSSEWLSQPSSISSRSTRTIMVDEKGNQIPLKSPSVHQGGGKRLEQLFPDVSYHGHISQG